MRVPQELIDAIIGELDASEERDEETKKALESCALVSRSFVQLCQMRLFASISVHDYEQDQSILSQQLSTVLSSSPHLASYIRSLDLYYNLYDDEDEGAAFVAHILSNVTKLNRLILTSAGKDPFPINSATVSVFSLPSLRRVELYDYRFSNVFEIHSLLTRSVSLKCLTLHRVDFTGDDNHEPHRYSVARVDDIAGAHTARHVVLESLTLIKMEPLDVEEMLNSFTTVDVQHLQSLYFIQSPISGFLKANAGSIKKLKMEETVNNFETSDYVDEVYPNILACNNHLSLLELKDADLEPVLDAISFLGDLSNLRVLKTISITLVEYLDTEFVDYEQPEWAALDAILRQLPGVEINIYACFDPETDRLDSNDIEVLKKSLPSVSGGNSLHIYSNADGNSEFPTFVQ
ncbi:hypothetical protein C8R43DRAFT_1021509 [Mycena crocata]|nr:hypothetical protein C8R43DRAFT_1021509 [Mycena crocata]